MEYLILMDFEFKIKATFIYDLINLARFSDAQLDSRNLQIF